MMLSLTFEIQLLSDYHVGAGQRFGPTVNSALLRDFDKTPVLRGTMLAGLLRDGLSNLSALTPANALLKQADVEAAACKRIFGAADSPKRWIFSSARPITSRKDTERWGSVDVARVRINPRTRRAAEKQLFKQEEGDSRLRFQFTAQCEGATLLDQADAALLVASARVVRHLGAARRRGRGHCEITLCQAEGAFEGEQPLTDALQQFKTTWLGNAPLPRDTAAVTDWSLSKLTNPKTVRLHVAAYNVEPILIAQSGQAGNALESRQIITGGAFLGALASRAAQRMGLRGQTASSEFVELFLRGNLRVTDLLPAHDVGNQKLVPSIVPPRAFAEDSTDPAFADDPDDSGKLYDLLVDAPPENVKIKPIKDRLLLNRPITRHEVAMREEAHIEIDPDTGRVTQGQLYEYIVVEAGQWFVGEISLPADWLDRLSEATGLAKGEVCELRFGKATRRGYGATRVLLESAENVPEAFIMLPIKERVTQSTSQSTTLSLFLLSDAILLDKWHRPLEGWTETWLQTLFSGYTVQLGKAFSRSRIVDSFNTHRRIARWRDVALEAGAIASVTVGNITDWAAFVQRLVEIERKGIGVRRSEGFGRIAFNHSIQQPSSVKPQQSWVSAVGQSKLLASSLYEHQLQRQQQFIDTEWPSTLADHKTKLKQLLGADAAPVARLLYLYRYRPLAALQKWLADDNFVNHAHLWGEKLLPNRPVKEPLSKDARKLLRELVEPLESRSRNERAGAITALAELIDETAGGE